jgi:hypothetical protein
MVVRSPAGGGIRAIEHHSESPEAMFANIPGLRVVNPLVVPRSAPRKDTDRHSQHGDRQHPPVSASL